MTLLSNLVRGNAALQQGPDASVHPAAELATILLPYQPESVGVARRLVRAKVQEWGLDDLMDDAVVIVSELVTNSVETCCQTRMLVGVRRPSDHTLRILVSDGSRSMPVMVQAGPDATSGRGLAIIHRLTHGRWGVTLLPFGKVVHADLTTPATIPR
ncbi:ATP-binding protein [Kitasatospora cathayae]|uniref:ATP-binding protein n=1 Tax=Kitasatospora cathayae TaxID=3004092 RepID=A0ABY7Q1J6_9ACTN|nr:ATP-binding protein [Kitasatospora sp. HUAS 3-15]WBP86548.1 ATP-binding protein [Kitasatospora sp. HUAS 3-15]